MIRRTFLITMAAVSAAILSPLKALGVGAKRGRYPDFAVEFGALSVVEKPQGFRIEWWKAENRLAVQQLGTGLPLVCAERASDGWATFRNECSGIRFKLDVQADVTNQSCDIITSVDYYYWSNRPVSLPAVYGVKDSTKPAGLEIDWFARNECPTGEPHA
jgi:hypothetical protein